VFLGRAVGSSHGCLLYLPFITPVVNSTTSLLIPISVSYLQFSLTFQSLCQYIFVSNEHKSVTNFMEHGPSWEADSCNLMLWKPKVHYSVHKSQTLDPIVSHLNSVPILPPYLFKIHSNIILLSTHRSGKWSPHFRFFDKSFILKVIWMPLWNIHPYSLNLIYTIILLLKDFRRKP
jgi:hypothetical protein